MLSGRHACKSRGFFTPSLNGYKCYTYCIHCIPDRGGFRISSTGWQRYLQGVAKISQGVAKQIARYLLPLSVFFISYTTLLIYAIFLHFRHIVIKKYLKYHFFSFSCSSFIFYKKIGSPQRPRFRGVETPWNGQGVARGAAPPPETASVPEHL